MLLGTVDYMSPEQAKGDPIDARSDVFSLGAMLYEMIAGARPFTSGHALGVLHEIVYGAIVPLRTRRPDATADIERIVLHALERDVTARYQTMEEFSSDLRRAHRDLLAGAPTAVDMPAAVFAPPPLPPLPLPIRRPPFNPGRSLQFDVRAVATTVRVRSSIHRRTRPARDSGGRRYGRRARQGRSFWKTAGIVIAILYMVNWMRNWLFDALRCEPRAWRGRCRISEAVRDRPGRRGRRRHGPLADRLKVGRDPAGQREDLLEARPETKDPVSLKRRRMRSTRRSGLGWTTRPIKRSPRRVAPDCSAEGAARGRPDR